MGKIKVISAIVFMAIAMASGGKVSNYEMNKGLVDVKDMAQMQTVNTVQVENEKMEQAEDKSKIQADKVAFSCGVLGCIQEEEHQHSLCGIDGCMEIGKHSHAICDIAECAKTEAHMHNGEYCYPHSVEDGHAYHNCGVSGCTEVENHTHNSCGVSGCTKTGEHSHRENSSSHHTSSHGKDHH